MIRRILDSTLARSSAGFIAGSFLQRSVPLLLLPILTRFLSAEDYGRVALYTLSVSLLEPLVGLSSTGAVSRQFFERDRLDFRNYVANCLYLLGATTVVVAAVLALAGPTLASVLTFSSSWLWAALFVAAGRYIVNVLLTLWQVNARPFPYTMLSVIQSAGTLGLSLVFIAGAGWDWRGRVAGEVISVGVTALVAWALLRRNWVRPGYAPEHIRHAALFGTGLLPHLYGGLMLVAADRVFLAKLTTMEQVGLYAVAMQLSSVISVLASSFNLGWIPWLFERLKRNTAEDRRRIRQIILAHNVGLLVLALLFSAMARPLLALLVGPEFRGAAPFVLLLSLGAAAGGMYNMAVNPLFFANKTYLVPIASVGAGLTNVALNWILIPQMGPMGAAVAFAVSSLVLFLLAWLVARDVLPPPHDALSAPTLSPRVI